MQDPGPCDAGDTEQHIHTAPAAEAFPLVIALAQAREVSALIEFIEAAPVRDPWRGAPALRSPRTAVAGQAACIEAVSPALDEVRRQVAALIRLRERALEDAPGTMLVPPSVTLRVPLQTVRILHAVLSALPQVSLGAYLRHDRPQPSVAARQPALAARGIGLGVLRQVGIPFGGVRRPRGGTPPATMDVAPDGIHSRGGPAENQVETPDIPPHVCGRTAAAATAADDLAEVRCLVAAMTAHVVACHAATGGALQWYQRLLHLRILAEKLDFLLWPGRQITLGACLRELAAVTPFYPQLVLRDQRTHYLIGELASLLNVAPTGGPRALERPARLTWHVPPPELAVGMFANTNTALGQLHVLDRDMVYQIRYASPVRATDL